MLTRFAPAPTGYLHLGHVANAIRVWDEARTRGGQVLLRIEDHDRERCRPEYEAALLDDLDWLGFIPDIYPTEAFRAGPCESRQSDRVHIYAGIAEQLRERGLIYACRCSRKDLLERTSTPTATSGISAISAIPAIPAIPAISAISAISGISDIPYPGTCADLGLPFDGPVVWRVRLPRETVTFEDRWCGTQVQTPADQCGDLSIRDRHGNWTYQFVVTVDDHLQGITDVIRGVDLLPSTGRQILLSRLIGRPRPAAFGHHPLIMKSPTQKLSKSDKDAGVRDLRAAGMTRLKMRQLAKEAMGQ